MRDDNCSLASDIIGCLFWTTCYIGYGLTFAGGMAAVVLFPLWVLSLILGAAQ